jgi:3-oxoacyl-(acyl-carrier-protein) synthase
MAQRPEPCPVSSLKAAIGELMGPAALIGVVTAIIELEQGRRFGTLGLERPPSAGAAFPGATATAPMRRVMVNATGVSGTYGCALLEAP